jgi:hypothetical protein
MALTIRIKADASHFKKTIAGIEVQASGLTGVMGKLATSNLAFGAALSAAAAGAVALGAGLAFIKDASGKAAGIESLTMQFETLLGSADKAAARMQEIKTFAASTPFEVANLSETSKLLQTLGGDLLATGAGLRMVGDAASIAGQPIQEVGLHIGRLFNAITSGTSAGESVARLQELGLMTGKVKLEFEGLAAAQKKGLKPVLDQNEALLMLQGVFSKTAGAMERLSLTTEGKLSNMRDAVDNLKVSFGTGFNEGLKTALDATNNFLPQLESQFATAGQTIGMAITDAVNGNYDMFVNVGLLMGEAIKQGIMDIGGNALVEGILRPAYAFVRSPTGYKTDQYGMDQAEILFGPKRSVGQRAEDIKTALAPNVSDLKQSKQEAFARGTERWGEYLRRQAEATDELVRQGKKITKENMNQLMFSR